MKTRTWLNIRNLDLAPWEHRLRVAVELDEHTVLYITEGGNTHIMCFGDEPIHMPSTWELLDA